MSIICNVAEAKAQLSRLIDAALAGQEVILARAGTPVARLVPLERPAARELGFVPMVMPADRFDALDPADLAAWE